MHTATGLYKFVLTTPRPTWAQVNCSITPVSVPHSPMSNMEGQCPKVGSGVRSSVGGSSLRFLSCAPVETMLCSWLTGMGCPCPLNQSCHEHCRVLFFWGYRPFAKAISYCRFNQTPTSHLHPLTAKSPFGVRNTETFWALCPPLGA